MKITIEVVGSVFRVEIDNQPETANETLGGTGDDCSHGKGGAWPPQEGASSSLGNDSLRVVTAGETATNSDGGLDIVTKHTEIAEPSTASKVSVLRPHCKNPTTCGGYGDKHCHSCSLRVIREDAA